MEIEELVWLGQNEAKLASAHDISRREVEDLVAQCPWVVLVHPDYPEQVRIVGATPAGRFITIALDPTEQPAAWRPVTGWPSAAREIAYYRQEYP